MNEKEISYIEKMIEETGDSIDAQVKYLTSLQTKLDVLKEIRNLLDK